MNPLPTVLVIDDEVRSQESLRRALEEDFQVFTASGATEAWQVMEAENIQIVLTDQRMPGESGVQFLKRARLTWPDSIRIIISGYTDSEDIIAGINEAGIYQYLLKPWQPDQLLLILRRAAELHRLQLENRRLDMELRTAEPVLRRQVEATRARVRRAFDLARIVRAPGGPMDSLCDQVQRAAGYDISILLAGESGTGKELLARAIHYASPRAERPFIVENCGALPDALLESELFGHKKGAYTGAHEDRVGLFQQAHGGSLFLDEIGETSPAFQVKLLRVLQEGEFRPLGGSRPVSVDVRVIAATNRDLEQEVRAGRFREDLYYRLAIVPIRLPPLRERPADIPPLARDILKRTAASLGRRVEGFSPELLARLCDYAWPGNVRELHNEIQRMLVLSDGNQLTEDMLAPHIRLGLTSAAGTDEAAGLRDRVDALEADLLRDALSRHQGNVSRAAQELGLSRLGLRNKLTRLGLAPATRGKGRPPTKEMAGG